MATLRSSIELRDNFSNRMQRISEANHQAFAALEKLEREFDRHDEKLDILGEQYRVQESRAQRLKESYEQEAIAVERLRIQHERLEKVNGAKSIQAYMSKIDIEEKIKEMEKYKEEMLKTETAAFKLGKSFDKAFDFQQKQIDQIEKIKRGIDNADSSQEQFNKRLERGADTTNNLLNKVKKLAGAYLGFTAIKKGLQATLGGAAELRKQSAVLEAAFGNRNIGKGYFKHLQNYAIETEHHIGDLISTTRDFMGLTKNTNKLRGLTDLANKLSIRTGNISSAGSMMQEAMSGRFGNLQRTLHLDNSQIEPLKQAIKRGSLDGIMEAFDTAFKASGLTNGIVEAYQNTPLDKLEDIVSRTKLRLAEVGQEALLSLDPILSQINTWLQSDNAAQFFNTMAFGLDMIVQGFALLFERIPMVMDYMSQGFDFASQVAQNLGITLIGLSPVILGLAAAWGIYNGIMLAVAKAKKMATAAQHLYNLALQMNPIGLVIAAIGGLIVAMTAFGSVTKGIRQVFSDAFGFVVDVAQGAINAVMNIINGAIRGINKVSGFFANLLGVDAKQIQEIEFKADFQDFKQKGQNLIETITFDDVKAKLGWDRFIHDPTIDAIDKLALQENNWNALQRDTLHSIDDSGKSIKNSVDKSQEELKWMRDIAEQEAINRFTTATLAPQLSVAFGDIRETADLDGIVPFLEKVLIEQLNIAAEGVHV